MGRSGTISQKLLARSLSLVAVCGAAVALAGCGGIEFQGKVFDYAGLSGSGSKEDVRMTERAPLLVPPDTKRLPPPGPEAVTPANWPVDSDLSRKQAAEAKAEAERQREAAASPDVPYAGKPKLLDHWLGKDKPKNDDLMDVPEPIRPTRRPRIVPASRASLRWRRSPSTTAWTRRLRLTIRSIRRPPTATRACPVPRATTPVGDGFGAFASVALAPGRGELP